MRVEEKTGLTSFRRCQSAMLAVVRVSSMPCMLRHLRPFRENLFPCSFPSSNKPMWQELECSSYMLRRGSQELKILEYSNSCLPIQISMVGTVTAALSTWLPMSAAASLSMQSLIQCCKFELAMMVCD